jgi:organic hydroperoxide reductase OsmC/OhrA
MIPRPADLVSVSRRGGATMSEYRASVEWSRDGAPFIDKRYTRGHRWRFDGGIEVPASSSVANAVDPEEAFVASLASCHLLSFLWAAAKAGFVVDSYRDEPVGLLAKNEVGKLAMTRVTLHPDVRFSGERRPTPEQLAEMHHQAHDECFIASSVKTDVRVEPVSVTA